VKKRKSAKAKKAIRRRNIINGVKAYRCNAGGGHQVKAESISSLAKWRLILWRRKTQLWYHRGLKWRRRLIFSLAARSMARRPEISAKRREINRRLEEWHRCESLAIQRNGARNVKAIMKKWQLFNEMRESQASREVIISAKMKLREKKTSLCLQKMKTLK